MSKIRKITAAVGAAAVLAAPATVIAGPAHADGPEKEKEFRVGGAEVDFKVEKDDGRFEVEVDIDEARAGSKWRVIIRHDGRLIHKKLHRADGEGDIDIDKRRPDTRGTDTFKVRVKQVGGPGQTRTIRMR